MYWASITILLSTFPNIAFSKGLLLNSCIAKAGEWISWLYSEARSGNVLFLSSLPSFHSSFLIQTTGHLLRSHECRLLHAPHYSQRLSPSSALNQASFSWCLRALGGRLGLKELMVYRTYWRLGRLVVGNVGLSKAHTEKLKAMIGRDQMRKPSLKDKKQYFK